jgi:hypothetical protein
MVDIVNDVKYITTGDVTCILRDVGKSPMPLDINSETLRFIELRRRLVNADPDIDEKALFDTLEGSTNLHEAIAAVIRSALEDEAMAKALRSRIEDMRQRLSRIESTAEAKREAALNAMERADMIKLTAPDFTVSVRINPPSLVITSEAEIPHEFWLPQPPKLNKKGLLDAINSGWAVPGAVLSNSKISLAIRTK